MVMSAGYELLQCEEEEEEKQEMSITDPIVPYYYERHGTFILKRGRETFYNDDRQMLEFDTEEEAIRYIEEKLYGKATVYPDG